MKTLQTIIEPTALLVTWQPKSGGERYLVATITRHLAGYVFTYQPDSKDFQEAREAGFLGHPAFSHESKEHTNNVLEPFLRRLPPKSRGDFSRYLEQHCLPSPFHGSDFALLGYTGAKSPADGFILFPDFSGVQDDFQYVLEVAGTRYEKGFDLSQIQLGDSVRFVPESDNEFDRNAIAIYHNSHRIGYVNKVFCSFIKQLLHAKLVSATITKKNGTPDRPLLYLMLEVSNVFELNLESSI